MPIAAVPKYLGPDFQSASPGMRFGMYLKVWGINERSGAMLWETHDVGYETRGPQQQEREVKRENKVSALREAKSLGANDKKIMKELLDRQKHAFDAAATGDARLQLDALAVAPFTTGLGNEHPLENGFAFLNPYGLPYLPGSGVKGVLRQAARELASGDWAEAKGWSEDERYPLMQGDGEKRRPVLDKRKQPVLLSMLDVLFGRETLGGESEHLRGALVFWDVVPQICSDSLAVEIMTPHQSHYYQGKAHAGSANPHDSGQPNPISFLSVPPGSKFVFHVQCDLARLTRLAPDLAQNHKWKALLEAAFAHAFQWLGFGAKTAVGYGAMQEDPAARAEREKQAEAIKREAIRRENEERQKSMSPDDLAYEQHSPQIEEFRVRFETARKAAYKPGGLFDAQRNEFMKTALAWQDARSRLAASELLGRTLTKEWGLPGNKDSKQRLKDAVEQLRGGPT